MFKLLGTARGSWSKKFPTRAIRCSSTAMRLPVQTHARRTLRHRQHHLHALRRKLRATLDAPHPDREQTFSAAELQRVSFRNAGQRIDLFSRLPEVIKNAASESELFVRLVNLLLAGVPQADAAALVAVEVTNLKPMVAGRLQSSGVLHWDRLAWPADGFQPSQRLIQQVSPSTKPCCTLGPVRRPKNIPKPKASIGPTALRCPAMPAAVGRCILPGALVSTRPAVGQSDDSDLRDDIKFTEMAAATLSSLRELNRLGRQQAGLSQFFAPVVMEALATDDPEQVLAPRETEVAVLFCDLRGFSRTSERSASDLLGLLERVSKATRRHDASDSRSRRRRRRFSRRCRDGLLGLAAGRSPTLRKRPRSQRLGIRAQFEAAATQPEHPLADFRVGIGIATGRLWPAKSARPIT